jgi:hypothetical protein
MQTITLRLSADAERMLRHKAERNGMTLEAYIQQLADREALGNGASMAEPVQPPIDLDRQLDELAADLPRLPALPPDFSRADIYGGHD